MEYTLYKFKFRTPLHVGKKLLTDGRCYITADTIFSALCHEALKMGGVDMLNMLVDYVENNKLIISDAMPFSDDKLYIPKPLMPINKVEDKGDSKKKKAFKKLQYIPYTCLDEFIKGDFVPENESNSFGKYSLNTKVAVGRQEDVDSEPYNVGTFTFDNEKKCGLYIYVGYEENEDDEVLCLIDDLLIALSYTGIGGKVSSGLGKFELINTKIPNDMLDRITKEYKMYMTLSISLPSEDEMSIVDNAYYMLEKRSGFVCSSTYSKNLQSNSDSGEYVRKNDFYMFVAGSCFEKKYTGKVYDISGEGSHPVYKYAKPLMIGVK